MTKSSKAFHDYVINDLFHHVEGITSRAMFGGYGIYQHGVFFALIAQDTLYFRVNEQTRPEYEARGSEPFHYLAKDNKQVTITYWEVPSDVMEDPDMLQEWIVKAVAAKVSAK